MAPADWLLNTSDKTIVDAARDYCAETEAFARVCEMYEDIPDEWIKQHCDRLRAARRRAFARPAGTMRGVLAKARMLAATEDPEADPLVLSLVSDLLRVTEEPLPRFGWPVTCLISQDEAVTAALSV